MPQVQETIPEALGPQVDAALAWLNRERQAEFSVTGIIDADAALAVRQAGGDEEALELQLVLRESDICLRERFRVQASDSGFDVTLLDDVAAAEGATPSEFDPPPGARRGWLEAALARHAFVVLVFYRGFW